MFLLLISCTAVKSTVHLGQLEEAWHDAGEAGADNVALYEYTLAEQYRLKAHEEWGYSDYGASEELARQGTTYARVAEDIATSTPAEEFLDEPLEDLPEDLGEGAE